MVKAATRGHLRPLGKSGHLRPLEWLRVAASGCFLWDWNTSATRRRRPLAVSCGHSTERPLAATCGHSGKAATCGHSSGCKWLLFMRLKHLGHASKAATCGHLRPLDRAATCGHSSGCEWLQVAAFLKFKYRAECNPMDTYHPRHPNTSIFSLKHQTSGGIWMPRAMSILQDYKIANINCLVRSDPPGTLPASSKPRLELDLSMAWPWKKDFNSHIWKEIHFPNHPFWLLYWICLGWKTMMSSVGQSWVF